MTTATDSRPLASRVIETRYVDWRNFQYIQQDDFKELPQEAKSRLKNSIRENNFTQPFYVWQDLESRIMYCLDGRHRTLVLEEMAAEGCDIPVLLPATFIHCEGKNEAAKLVLVYSSIYATVTESGFHDFVQTYGLDMAELQSQINLPDFSFEVKVDDTLLRIEDDEFDVEKAIEEIISAMSAPGDIFQLGGHIVICGNSQETETFRHILEPHQVKVLYCDPPYNINYNYERGLGKKQAKYTNQTFSDSLADDDYSNLISTTLANGLRWCGPDAHVFYWCDESYIALIQNAFDRNLVTNRRVCFWIKDRLNPVPQIAFNKVIEPCVYGTTGSPYLNPLYTNLTEVWNTDLLESHSLEDLLSMAQLWFSPRDNTSEYQHPTTKPIRLHEKPLKRCSKQGDTVMDLFGGSGSTLISCEQLNRKAILIERDPVFVDVIIRRYMNFCKKKGVEVNFKHLNGQLTLSHFHNEPQPVN